MRKLTHQLIVLWRTDGEQALNFGSESEAKQHMYGLERALGHLIVKMEVVPLK